MKHFTETREIERIDPPETARLISDYVLPGKPVVIRGALRGSRAERWSPEALKERLGDRRVSVILSDTGRYEPKNDPDWTPPIEKMSLAEFIDRIGSDAGADGPGQAYLQQTSIPDRFPELIPDIPVAALVRPELVTALNLWVGPAKTVTPLHYDLSNNFLVQVHGKKKVVLFEADQSPLLYPADVGSAKYAHVSPVDIDEPDFEAHPRLAEAKPTVAVLEPGDALMMPSCCWHQVYGLTPSISVNVWWQLVDEQLLMPSLTMWLPRRYQEIPERFQDTIKHRFESFEEYACALRASGQHGAGLLCHLKLLEHHLEGLAARHCIRFKHTGEGVTPAVVVVRKLHRAGAMTSDQRDEYERWFDAGRRVLAYETVGFSELETMQEAIVGLLAAEPPNGRHERPTL